MMDWIPWESAFMRWLTADSMRITIFGTLILCVFGCVLAAFFGFWSRRSKTPRFLRAIITTVLLSWTYFVGGGGVGVMPAVFILSMTPKLLISSGPGAFGFLIVGISFFSMAVVFAAYWICSKPKTVGQSL